jgi:hypothetical protein
MRVRAGIAVHDNSNTKNGGIAVRERESRCVNF